MGAEMPANLSDMDLLMTPKKKTLSIWLLSHQSILGVFRFFVARTDVHTWQLLRSLRALS